MEINNTEESFVLLNMELEITSFNSQARRHFLEYFKKELARGEDILKYTPPERQEIVKGIYKKVLEGHEVSSEIIISLPDATEKNLAIKYKPAKNQQGETIGVFMSAIDITEIKKATVQKELSQKKIEQSEKQYRQILETAQEGIWLIDAGYKTTFVNNKMCDILGYAREEMLAKELYLFMDEEGKKIAGNLMQDQINGYIGILPFKFISKTGNEVWTKVATNPLFNDSGAYQGALAMITDIPESKKAEGKLNKANRLYTFISQVNKTIVHMKDEAELFRSACQIAFEFGKFTIAWIGIFDKQTKKIRLADQNGIAAEDLHLFADAHYIKKGPQGQVLHTGSYYLSNNIEKDLQLKDWKAFAAKHGICSAIVLPIRKSGDIIGTLNLYSAELDFFDKEEIALLIDVAQDISFALEILEKARKQQNTEELMVKNEKRFRVLIEKSVDMKTLTSAEGKIIYASNSITKFLGYSLEEFLNKLVFELIHPDDTLPEKSWTELMQIPGASFNLQQRMLHKNGNWIWCEGTITNMLQEPGINAFVSNFRDISEKKIIEQQSEFDRINLDALINNTTDLMWSLDKDFKLITFNQPFFNIIRLVSGTELKKGDDVFSAALSPEQYRRFKASYRRAFSGEAFTEIEHIPPPVDSWSEISYYPIRNGNEVIGTACHSRDITERKKSEEAVLYSLNEKNTILESIGDAFFAVDEKWIVTYWNKHAEDMLGVLKKETVGRYLWDVFKDSLDSESYRKYHEAVETNQVIHFEDYYPPVEKWYEISAYPSPNGLSVYFKDVSERKLSDLRLHELNEDLANKAKELAISNEQLEQFAYVASHDLQEPLRMVTSFLTQIENKYKDILDDKGKTYIEFAVDGAKRMRQIILDLLEFSRVGRTEDSKEDVDLNVLVKEIQMLLRKQVREKKAIINVSTLPVIHAHKIQLEQVFQNLISNALKYAKENTASNIQISAKELKIHWQFTVTDNGIGIGEEYFDKIFVIFQRLHNKNEYSGTGIGLAITKKIIESLGGKIWLESTEGKGSTFSFTILK